jgi:hypothetical protein
MLIQMNQYLYGQEDILINKFGTSAGSNYEYEFQLIT